MGAMYVMVVVRKLAMQLLKQFSLHNDLLRKVTKVFSDTRRRGEICVYLTRSPVGALRNVQSSILELIASLSLLYHFFFTPVYAHLLDIMSFCHT